MQMRCITWLLVTVILVGCSPSNSGIKISVDNLSSLDRVNEMVEVNWETVLEKIPGATGQTVIVTDKSGQPVPFQLITNGTGTVESLLFPATVNAKQTSVYRISPGEPEAFEPLVYGRLVPERKDDFTWENNRSAFRLYGPALKATGEISNGMDFWAKRTEKLIIDKWYVNDLSGVASYHDDHGEGVDFYKVGRTLGLGMTAPFYNDTLCLGDNFVSAEILDTGPLRITFKLTYAPYLAGEVEIQETRVISLDAYRHFNRVTNTFEADTPELTVATGIVMGATEPSFTHGMNEGIIAYETPAHPKHGTIYTAAIHPKRYETIKATDGHYLGINSYQPGTPYTYYAGGGWSKAGFDSFEQWTRFVEEEKEKIDQPLSIRIH
ncbi:MAG: DUF4861 family protein [Fermentimonas sp.]